jgi:hypothetical protein
LANWRRGAPRVGGLARTPQPEAADRITSSAVATMTKLGERRIENNMTGFKLATSVGGVATGERGD